MHEELLVRTRSSSYNICTRSSSCVRGAHRKGNLHEELFVCARRSSYNISFVMSEKLSCARSSSCVRGAPRA
eukprot:4832298-Pleurochrysis_carterae.AAC.1